VLPRRQPVREQVADEDVAEQGHRKGLDRPVDEERHADAAAVAAHLVQAAEVHLHQHRDDHHPDQQADREIDPRELESGDRSGNARQQLAEADAGRDAGQHPERQPALEEAEFSRRGLHRPSPGVGCRSDRVRP
jgi:hypothetical protein